MAFHTSRAGTLTAVLLAPLLHGCGDSTAPPPPPPPPPPPAFVPASLRFTTAPASGAPRDTVGLVVRVRDAAGRPGGGVVVSFTLASGDGTLTAAQDTTDGGGYAGVGLVVGRADSQRVRASVDTLSAVALVRAVPVLGWLELQQADTTITALDDTIRLRVLAFDRDSVAMPLPSGLGLLPSNEVRALARLPVLGVGSTPPAVWFTGPGTVQLAVRSGSIISVPARFTVSPALPIVDTLPPVVADSGDAVGLLGYRLDLLTDDAITVDGVPAPLTAKDSATAVFAAPGRDFSGCQGRARASVSAAGARVLTPLAFWYGRADALTLAVGAAVRLGAASPQCLRLAPADEYMLVFLDARGVQVAQTVAEGDSLMGARFTLGVTDRSGGTVAAATPARRLPARTATASRWTQPLDRDSKTRSLATWAGAAAPQLGAALVVPPDAYFLRRTPYAVGDSVSFNSIWPDGVFEWRRGHIVRVTGGTLAVVVMDFDSALALPSRLGDLYAAMDTVYNASLPVLRTALTDSLPEVGFGTGQILVVVRNIGWAGGAGDGPGIVALSPFPLSLTPSGNIQFTWFEILTHELAHQWQDRFEMAWCQETGTCGGAIYNRWGFEGGADFLMEEAGRAARGVALHANAPRALATNGWYYFPCCLDSIPGATFEAGYAGSAWLLRRLLHQTMAAGASYADALREVSRGAYEGWYGHFMAGGPDRPGMHGRLAPWLGAAWDPVAELVGGALAVAMDDRESTSLFEPTFLDAWQLFGAPPVVESGSGAQLLTTPRGTSFGYVLLRDAGRGGTFELTVSIPGVEWALARVR